MLGFPIGLVYVNAVEWYAHKVLLHELGRNRKHPSSTHWDHHRVVRRNAFYDREAYPEELSRAFDADRSRNEIGMLVGLAALHTPLLPIAPFFVGACYYGAFRYYYVHRRAHTDPAWARKHVPWHVDHHLNANQNANWCVTKPWFDYVMGTRIVGDPSIRESNPLGYDLPAPLARSVDRLARRLLPRAYAKLDALAAKDRRARGEGRQGFVPDFARA